MSQTRWRRRSLVVALGVLTLFVAVVVRPIRFLFEEALPDWWDGLAAAWRCPAPPEKAPEVAKPQPLVIDEAALAASLPAGFGRILNPWPVWEAAQRLDQREAEQPGLLQGAPREVLEILEAYRGR